MYYLFTRLVPIPATSDKWHEVDVDVNNLSVAYGEEVTTDEENPESDSIFSADQDEANRSTIKVPRDETKRADSP